MSDSDNDSVRSIDRNEWKLLNKKPKTEVKLARFLVQVEKKETKDTIFHGPCLPICFNPHSPPYGLAPGSLEIQLLSVFYTTPTICQFPGCNHAMRNFTERVLHHIYSHQHIPLYFCVDEECMHMFNRASDARAHYINVHRQGKSLLDP